MSSDSEWMNAPTLGQFAPGQKSQRRGTGAQPAAFGQFRAVPPAPLLSCGGRIIAFGPFLPFKGRIFKFE
ncbi:hypothetical protein [Devosia alba]|uniref:hypothetical protein n=1 Tax=Devosia alba TaxID=3152360 RepID=UPI003266DCB2